MRHGGLALALAHDRHVARKVLMVVVDGGGVVREVVGVDVWPTEMDQGGHLALPLHVILQTDQVVKLSLLL